MDIYPSGIKVPNGSQGEFGKPVTNKGYTPGTFGVTVDKKVVPKEVISSVPQVGGEVRNARFQELLQIEKMLKKRGFTLERDAEGISEINLPSDLYTQEELEDALGEKLTLAAAQKKVELDILSKLVAFSGEYSNLHKETELLEGKLQNPATLAVLEQLSEETKKLIEEIKDKPLGAKLDELRQKLSEFEKIVERAKAEAAKIPAPTIAPEAQIKNEEPAVVAAEESVPTVPEASPKTPEKVEVVPKFFKVGQRFLLPKDHTSDEATWEVTILMPKEGAMMMKQIDGAQKGRTERFYFKPFKDLLERLYLERQQTSAKTTPEKPVAETSKASTAPKINESPSVLRPTKQAEKKQEQIIRLIGGRKINAEWTKGETGAIKGSEENIQKTRAQTEVREKFEDMFTHDQKAFISLYTVASKNEASGAVDYTENESLRKHPYRDVIKNILFTHNVEVKDFITKENKLSDIQRKNFLSENRLVYGPSSVKESEKKEDTRTDEEKLNPDLVTKSVRDLLTNSMGEGMTTPDKVVLGNMATNNESKEIIPVLEKDPQKGLKKISAILATRIKNLSNNPNNLSKGKLSWIAFAVVVGGTGAYANNVLNKQPVPISASLNKNEVVVKDTWTKYFHFGKTNPAFAEFPEDISKLSASQLKATLIQKYAKSYFDGTNNQRQTLLALGMFGDLVRNDTTKGTYDHLDDKDRAELSYLWDALNDVSMATSGEKLQAKTYEAAIEEVKEKVTNKEK